MMEDWPDPQQLSNSLNTLIDDALVRERSRDRPRPYLGGSNAGKPCLRAMAYDYYSSLEQHARYQRSPLTYSAENFRFSGRVCRRFALGHAHEDLTASWLRLAGFRLETKQNGKQLAYFSAQGRLGGHIDGRIIGGPLPLPYPLLWEHKLQRSDRFKSCASRGLQKAEPDYYYQCQMYMGMMDLEACLFTAVNSNDSDLYAELVPLSRTDAQWAYDRQTDVVNAKSPEDLPRISNHPDHWQCRLCSWRARCWQLVEGQAS